jgi:hypothetical protein
LTNTYLLLIKYLSSTTRLSVAFGNCIDNTLGSPFSKIILSVAYRTLAEDVAFIASLIDTASYPLVSSISAPFLNIYFFFK